MHAWSIDGTEDRDGLAAIFKNGHSYHRILEIFLEPGSQSNFEVVHGKACGLEPARERNVDVAAHVYSERAIANFVGTQNMDCDLVIGPRIYEGNCAVGWAKAIVPRRIIELS